MKITLTHIDTACVLLEINGYKILTDPTLDEAGKLYHHGFGAVSRKNGSPAMADSLLTGVELVLLSHHQHKDNFDNKGKAFTSTVPLVLSTPKAAKEIKGITGLEHWEPYKVDTDKVPGLTITATPAQHHPGWIPDIISGPVIGFIIQFEGQTNGVIYLTGDTVYFKGIDEVAKRFRIDTAIINLGGVEFRYLTGWGRYTMGGRGLLQTARVLHSRRIIPIHYKGWSHFKEKEGTLRKIIDTDPEIKRTIRFPEPGIPMEL